MNKKIYLLAVVLLISTANLIAQCKVNNTFFQTGEQLNFDLYIKIGFFNAKAGNSTMKITSERYRGVDGYKMTLTARTTGAAHSIFAMKDTLSTNMTKELVPLKYTKRAHEEGNVVHEDISYSYSNSKINLQSKRQKNGALRYDKSLSATGCVYDMMSVIFYARTLDYASMKKGDFKSVDYVDGQNLASIAIRHKGTETIEANDGKKYDCIVLSLVVKSNDRSKFEDKNESMRVYVTNDSNRLPVRLDIKLKKGSSRAMLRSYKGNLHTVTTK